MEYKQYEEIGAGGFAKVFLVKDANGALAARKIFWPNQPHLDDSEIEGVKSRFIREVSILSEISHPNVVSILCSETNLNPPSYIMPLAESTLADDMLLLKAMPIQNRINVFMDILAGLEAIHDLSIYHRDLKPQNILKINGQYVISDFGLVSLDRSQISVLTKSGFYMNSDRYTAPEITSELKYASRASDIYSAGCLLHDLTTSGSGIRVPCNQIKDIDNPYEAILKICTRFDKNQRFQNVRDLREAVISVSLNSMATPIQDLSIQYYLNLLLSSEPTESNIVEQFISSLENTEKYELASILLKVSPEVIKKIISTKDNNLISRFSYLYSHWISHYQFDFSFCDVIAARLDLFWEYEDPEIRSYVLKGLLLMGTSHNRWYVEQKFVTRSLQGNEFDLRRFVLESSINRELIINALLHLSRSIGFNLELLPHILLKGLFPARYQ